MTKVLIAGICALALMTTYNVGVLLKGNTINTVYSDSPPVNTKKIESNIKEGSLDATIGLQSKSEPVVVTEQLKILVLENSNTVVFRTQVDTHSVSRAIMKLQVMSNSLRHNDEIFLVLDTPGGSVFDGLDLIDYTDALPQKVNTVTLFAASMGFQFAQAMGDRYIVRNGTLMSHRASLGGLGGQLDGEFETRYKMIKRFTDFLDVKAATRLNMSLVDYKKLIKDEYWVSGFDAVKEGAADKQVLVRCGTSLKGSEFVDFMTFFGPVTVEFSKCPLVKAPLSVNFDKLFNTTPETTKESIKTLFSVYLTDKSEYYNKYVKTGEFTKYFKTK